MSFFWAVSAAACCWEFNPKGGELFISADFLYWRSENHGFAYAYELDKNITFPTTIGAGKIARIEPKWAPGYRVGLGWNTHHDFWDLFLDYTWYRNHAHVSRTSDVGFTSTLPLDTGITQYGSVSANSHFNLNIGDFELGRLIYLTCSIAFRPHLGVRGLTLHQKFHVQMDDMLLPGSFAVIPERKYSAKCNYWGVGPRAGLNGEFHCTEGFSILGKFAAALLYGKTEANAQVTGLSSGKIILTNSQNDDFDQLAPNLQMALGLQCQTRFWCERMFFKITACWEANYWWDQFNVPMGISGVPTPTPFGANQPLTMDGLTINAEWDF